MGLQHDTKDNIMKVIYSVTELTAIINLGMDFTKAGKSIDVIFNSPLTKGIKDKQFTESEVVTIALSQGYTLVLGDLVYEVPEYQVLGTVNVLKKYSKPIGMIIDMFAACTRLLRDLQEEMAEDLMKVFVKK